MILIGIFFGSLFLGTAATNVSAANAFAVLAGLGTIAFLGDILSSFDKEDSIMQISSHTTQLMQTDVFDWGSLHTCLECGHTERLITSGYFDYRDSLHIFKFIERHMQECGGQPTSVKVPLEEAMLASASAEFEKMFPKAPVEARTTAAKFMATISLSSARTWTSTRQLVDEDPYCFIVTLEWVAGDTTLKILFLMDQIVVSLVEKSERVATDYLGIDTDLSDLGRRVYDAIGRRDGI